MFTPVPPAGLPGGHGGVWACRGLLVAGVLAVGVAWAQASNTVDVSAQIDWAAVGLAGVVAVTLALLGPVLAARRGVADRVHRLTAALAASVGTDPVVTIDAEPTARAAAVAESLVASPSMARYHRASCPLTAGKPVRPESRQAHEGAGRQACGVCTP